MDEQERKAMLKKTFDTISTGYDMPALRFFPRSAEHLARHLSLSGSEHVLDVATGTGTAAMALAESLSQGQVTGVDFSEGMLRQAEAKMEAKGIKNVKLLQMDMQELDFPAGHFDAAACAFGVFFVDDMAAQARLISDKVKKGGRFVMTTFNDSAFSPLVDLFFQRLKEYGIDAPPETRKRLYTQEQCASLFREAGLRGVSVDPQQVGYHLEDAGGWWDVIWNAGFRRFVNQLPEDSRERFRVEHMGEVQALSTPEGIWLDVEVLYTVGINA